MSDLTNDKIDALIIKSGVMDRAWPLQTALHAFARDVFGLASQSPAPIPEQVAQASGIEGLRQYCAGEIENSFELSTVEDFVKLSDVRALLATQSAQEVTQQAAPECLREALALCDSLIHTDGYIARSLACELRPKIEAAMLTQQAAKAETAEQAVSWEYCPECGSYETHEPQEGSEGHYFCAACNQEWYSHIDYTDVVRSNLSKRAPTTSTVSASIPAIVREAVEAAFEERAGWRTKIGAAVRALPAAQAATDKSED